jgi:hypothetical protein
MFSLSVDNYCMPDSTQYGTNWTCEKKDETSISSCAFTKTPRIGTQIITPKAILGSTDMANPL